MIITGIKLQGETFSCLYLPQTFPEGQFRIDLVLERIYHISIIKTGTHLIYISSPRPTSINLYFEYQPYKVTASRILL